MKRTPLKRTAFKSTVAKKKKKPVKKKLITMGKLKKKTAETLQKLRRLEESDDNGYCQCVTCDKFDHYKNMQGGHFIPRGNLATLLMSKNINPQCPGCNGFGMKYGNAEKVYTLWMLEKHGRLFVDAILETVGKPFRISRAEYNDMYADFLARVKQHQRRIGDTSE